MKVGKEYENQGKCPICGDTNNPQSGFFWNKSEECIQFAVCKKCKTPFNVSADGKHLKVMAKTLFPKSLRWMFKP